MNETPDEETCGVDELVPDIDGPLSVGQAAELVGLSTYTLRWYERMGLLDDVARNHSGRRQYARADLQRLALLMRLRKTGMPVREMQRYVEFIRGGAATERQRLELLEAHRERVLSHIANLHRDLDIVNRKIDGYRRALSPAEPA